MMFDLVFKNVQYLDVKQRKFKRSDIAISNGKIVDIDKNLSGNVQKDCSNKFLVPGFIDGHIHLESSVISPEDFAKIVALHGTTAVITDPHEIANVCGINGIKWMIQKTKKLPIDVFFMISSCVPATPFDESAYILDSKSVEECFHIDSKRILGLAEVMNYPDVINGSSEVLEKIKLTKAKGKRVDGHAPGLTGNDLEKYIKAGIESDHECSTLEEAIEKLEIAKKLNQEFYIMIRQGTAAKNLEALFKLISIEQYKDFVMFATDDKHPEELYKEGHIDSIIRRAIELGVSPVDAYTTASYNAAKYFRLTDIGSIEVGKNADLVLLSDEKKCIIEEVYKNGELLDEKKINSWPINIVDITLDEKVRNSINMSEVTSQDFNCKGIKKKIIGLVPKQITTVDAGEIDDYDLKNDIIKIVVIESHKGTMHTGIAYLKGLGLKEGALGTTVAHDSHYTIIAGTNDDDIALVANEIRKMRGGKIVAQNGKVLASLPLPIANLMTDEPCINVIKKMEELKSVANISNKDVDPFMNLSFVSLAVIGDIRLLPRGVFDVTKWCFIE